MNHRTHSPFWDLMLAQPCTYCNAQSGKHCTSKSGGRSGFHAARFYAAKKEQPWTE